MPRKESESSSGSDHSHEEEDETLANQVVVSRYQLAAEITNAVLKQVVAAVKAGEEVGNLCDLGDKLITERTDAQLKKQKNIKKGIAMPTCISVDNCICHFSPLRSDPPVVLKDGQIVKIDLGTNIDGYIATAAHTVVVGATQDKKVTGDAANILRATYEAMEIAIRMLRPGNKNMDITTAIDKVAAEYELTPIENMVSHQLQRFQIDGEKQIIQNPGEKQRSEVEKADIAEHEVYAIDILFSNGKGTPKDMDTRTTVFKRNDDVQYSLKMKTSKTFLHECKSKHDQMPFTLRSFEDEVRAKMGVVECEKHNLVRPYQVLYEREGALVAQFKATVLVMPNGLIKVAGLPFDEASIDAPSKLKDEALVKTLKSGLKKKPVKKEKTEVKN